MIKIAWLLVLAIPILQEIQTAHGETLFSVIDGKGKSEIRSEISDYRGKQWLAKATFSKATYETGWSFLEIETNGDVDDTIQVYEAGRLEGMLTHDYIANHSKNVWEPFCVNRTKTCQNVDIFFDANTKWVNSMIKRHRKTSPFWHQVNLYYRQLEGIKDGYNMVQATATKFTLRDILMINMLFDLGTIVEVFGDRKENEGRPANLGSCSAIVKLLPDYEDLLMAHNTWTSYNTMLRVMKKYDISVHLIENSNTVVPGRIMAFSSYPGTVFSGDDFTVVSSGLVTMETTNGVYNTKLWPLVSENSVMESIRSLVANRLARNGHEWVSTFRMKNSGTYNNQWMVVDYNKFTPGLKPQKGLLTIAEQLPGEIMSMDLTNVLNLKGYWASYNVPYFSHVYNVSGYYDKFLQYGDWFSHDNCPRAKIFKREQAKVKDLTSLMDLMRYNNYKNDPYSACTGCRPLQNACNAIAARCDLNPQNGTYLIENLAHRLHGATDAKVINSTMIKTFSIYAVSGPTLGNGLPVFEWSELTEQDYVPHYGLPNKWKFKPLIHQWEL